MLHRLAAFAALFAVAAWGQGDTVWTIDTYAGTLPPSSGPALDAFLGSPADAIIDDQGVLYVVDSEFSNVRAVDDGTIRLFAGKRGNPLGDDGPASEAFLSRPVAVTRGADGDIYIADSGLFLVRRVDAQGIITTVAGAGGFGPGPPNGRPPREVALPSLESIAYDTAREILYLGFTGWIWKVENEMMTVFAGTGQRGFSGDGGPAVEAQIDRVADLEVGPDGSLFFADGRNNRIRRVNPAGEISTVVGSGESAPFADGTLAAEATIDEALDLAFDSTGRLHFADDSERIYRVNADDTLALVVHFVGLFGAGGATEAIDFDAADNLYVTDQIRTLVRMFPAGGGESRIVAGGSNLRGDGGPALEARLHSPTGLTFDLQGRLVFSDTANYAIRRVSTAGEISRVAGDGGLIPEQENDGAPADEASIGALAYLATAPTGDILFARGPQVRSVDPEGVLGTLSGFDPNGPAFVGALLPLADGSIYFVSQIDQVIYRREIDGNSTRIAGNGTRAFAGDGGPALEASFQRISDLAIDDFGNLFVADRQSDRIRKIDADTGIITTIAGNGSVTYADGPAADTALLVSRMAFGPDGALYLTSTFERILRIFQPVSSALRREGASPEIGEGAMIQEIAGSGFGGFSGDGGPALEARLDFPEGIGFGPDGRLYFADSDNHRIRVLEPASAELSGDSLTNAASFVPGAAPGAILSLFGEGLASETLAAPSLPLPLSLGGTGVSVVDESGAVYLAPLFFVSTGQINFLMPEDVPPGPATLIVRTAAGAFEGPIVLSAVAPGLFTMNEAGVGAVTGLRVGPEGERTEVVVFRLNEAAGQFETVPIALDPEIGDVYLSLFGTGILGAALGDLSVTVDGVAVPVLAAAPSAQFAGLDQVNIGPLPAGLSSGVVDVILTVEGGGASNPIKIEIQ